MIHQDHVRLIEKGIEKNSGGVWADFGSGEGAFTLALRDIAGPNVEIVSIDKNETSLRIQKEQFAEQFPNTSLHLLTNDFTQKLDLPLLDGLVVANAIHFQPDTLSTTKLLSTYVKPGGKFILVEYNVDVGNHWVPYPFSFSSFKKLAPKAGLKDITLLATIPSTFLEEIYAATAVKGE